MKGIGLLVLVLAIGGAGAYPDGMVAYWKLDDGSGTSAEDIVGGYDGTLHGPVWTTGQVGGALSFDGVDDYVDAGFCYPDIQQLRTCTVEAWVKWAGGTHYQTVVAKLIGRDDGNRFHFGFGLGVNWLNDLEEEGKVIGWWAQDISWPYALSAATIPKNKWTHLALTCKRIAYRDIEFHIYINGKEVTIEKEAFGLSGERSPKLYIGAGNQTDLGEYFNGAIDEVAIYDRVVSPDLIQQHYENGLDGRGYEEVLAVDIDIKPGSDPNSINRESKGTVPVAILSTDTFDAADINPETVTLAGASVKAKADGKPQAALEDVDDDGLDDLVVHVVTQELELDEDATTATLEGELFDGTPIVGSDSVKIVK